MITQQSQSAGDLSKYEVECDGIDITKTVKAIALWQDIFTPSWTANMVMHDTNNTLMVVPIKPGSDIRITMASSGVSEKTDASKTFKFVVSSIGNKKQNREKHMSYTISLISKDFMINQGKRIQKCYSNKKPSDCVSSAISEFIGGSVEVSECDNNFHVIVPNWSPFTFANWCCKIATRNKAADFVFYMQDDKKYKFKSLEDLYTNNSSGITFTRKPTNVREAGDTVEDHTIIISDYSLQHYDALLNISSGYYKTKLVSYDIIKKIWEKKVFEYGDDIAADKAKKPWDSNIFESEDSNISFSPKHAKMNDSGETYIDKCTEWATSRKSNIMKTEQDKLILQMPGGVKSWEFLGKTCEVDLPSETDMVDEQFDKYFRGTYLITSIYHSFAPDSYFVTFEMIKKRLDRKMS